MTAAVVQKIEDRIFDDVIASFRDPAKRYGGGKIVARVQAQHENLKDHDIRAKALTEALDSLYAERPGRTGGGTRRLRTPKSGKVDFKAGKEHQKQHAQLCKELCNRPVLSGDIEAMRGPMTTPVSSNPTTIGKCMRRASGGTPTMTAIAMANFANNGNVTACARNHSKVRIMSASRKFTGKIDKLTIVLDPPKPTEEALK